MPIVYLEVECHRSKSNLNISKCGIEFNLYRLSCKSIDIGLDVEKFRIEIYLENIGFSGTTQRFHEHSLFGSNIGHFECIPQMIPFFGIGTLTDRCTIDNRTNVDWNSFFVFFMKIENEQRIMESGWTNAYL